MFKNVNWSLVGVLLGVIAVLDMKIGNGDVSLKDMFPDAWLPGMVAWAKFIGTGLLMSLTALHVPGSISAFSSSNAQAPAAPKPAALPPAVVLAVLTLGISLMLAMSVGSASAQIKKTPQVTGNLLADIKANNAAGISPGDGVEALVTAIKSVSVADLQYAKALADGVASNRSKIRSTCYAAWIVVIQQSEGINAGANGAALGAPPDPSLFTHFEQIVQVVDNLQPDSQFMVACQPAANLLKMSLKQFVVSAATGIVGLGALGLGIP